MIPPSYMFKGIYHQHWEQEVPVEPDIEPVPFSGGLTTRVQLLLRSMLHRTSKPGRRYFGVHAYD